MEEELDPEIIKATQSSLGKYIKRPPLSDKLLKKPPFRFLHDIITTIIKTTGFFNGLFEEEELKSDNVKDRESKILFLNKVISVIGTTTGNNLSVKPSKIVSGQEPEKTNELLQCIALALDKKLSSENAVKQYKESVKLHAPGNKTKDATKVIKKNQQVKKLTSSQSTEKLIKNDKTESSTNKIKQKDNMTKKESPPKKVSTQSIIQSKAITSKKGPEKKKDSGRKTDSKISLNKNNKPNDITTTKQQSFNTDETLTELELTQDNQGLVLQVEISDSKVSKTEIDDNKNGNDSNDSSTLNKLSAREDLKEIILDKKEDIDKNITDSVSTVEEPYHNTDNKIEGNLNETESETNKIEKPLKETNNKIEIEKISKTDNKISDSGSVTPEVNVKRPLSVRPSSSRPSAPRLRDKHENLVSNENVIVGKVNIISENTPEEEDDNSIVIVDNTQDIANNQDQGDQLKSPSHQHGHLVQQILDAQKEFSHVSGKTEIEWQLGVQKSRDAVHEDIEQLRFNVQALSRVANPLGKLLDHIQEDVEVMRQELQQWSNTYEEASKELLKQRASNEESLNPLHTKIKQLGINITEKRDKINDLKIVIHKNASRIEKLLSSGQMQYL